MLKQVYRFVDGILYSKVEGQLESTDRDPLRQQITKRYAKDLRAIPAGIERVARCNLSA